MNDLLAARSQMAMSLAFHIIFAYLFRVFKGETAITALSGKRISSGAQHGRWHGPIRIQSIIISSFHRSSRLSTRCAVMEGGKVSKQTQSEPTADSHRGVTIRSQMVRYGQSIPTQAPSRFAVRQLGRYGRIIASFIVARHLHFYTSRVSYGWWSKH
jgi:hypothetical protein